MLLRLLMTAGFLLPLLLGSEWTARTLGERSARIQRENLLDHGAEMRARLESALNSTVFLAQGLVAYISGVDEVRQPQIGRALQALLATDPRIRNIGLAPDNVIRYLSPQQGNEAALGLRYADLPEQWPSVRKAIERRESVLAGPVHLVQGGLGIINRTPVFLPDGSYWGLISIVIDQDALLRDVGLTPEDSGVRYWLYGDNADDGSDDLILGGISAPDARALRLSIKVPGGHWTLVTAPSGGWASHGKEVQLVRAVLYGFSLSIAGFLYALLTSRAKARHLARQLSRLNNDLLNSNQELHSLAQHDPLTRLPNRRSFDAALQQAWRTCSEDQRPLTILMIDLDHFKRINDTYGHAVGDTALVELAAAIQGQVRRANDFVARYGGEEFIVLSTGLGADETAALAERIRRTVREQRLGGDRGAPVIGPMTVSIGIATAIPETGQHPYELIEKADRALYDAKRGGRDRVISAPPAPLPDPAGSLPDGQ